MNGFISGHVSDSDFYSGRMFDNFYTDIDDGKREQTSARMSEGLWVMHGSTEKLLLSRRRHVHQVSEK